MFFVVGWRCVTKSIFAVSSHFVGCWKLSIMIWSLFACSDCLFWFTLSVTRVGMENKRIRRTIAESKEASFQLNKSMKKNVIFVVAIFLNITVSQSHVVPVKLLLIVYQSVATINWEGRKKRGRARLTRATATIIERNITDKNDESVELFF